MQDRKSVPVEIAVIGDLADKNKFLAYFGVEEMKIGHLETSAVHRNIITQASMNNPNAMVNDAINVDNSIVTAQAIEPLLTSKFKRKDVICVLYDAKDAASVFAIRAELNQYSRHRTSDSEQGKLHIIGMGELSIEAGAALQDIMPGNPGVTFHNKTIKDKESFSQVMLEVSTAALLNNRALVDITKLKSDELLTYVRQQIEEKNWDKQIARLKMPFDLITPTLEEKQKNLKELVALQNYLSKVYTQLPVPVESKLPSIFRKEDQAKVLREYVMKIVLTPLGESIGKFRAQLAKENTAQKQKAERELKDQLREAGVVQKNQELQAKFAGLERDLDALRENEEKLEGDALWKKADKLRKELTAIQFQGGMPFWQDKARVLLIELRVLEHTKAFQFVRLGAMDLVEEKVQPQPQLPEDLASKLNGMLVSAQQEFDVVTKAGEISKEVRIAKAKALITHYLEMITLGVDSTNSKIIGFCEQAQSRLSVVENMIAALSKPLVAEQEPVVVAEQKQELEVEIEEPGLEVANTPSVLVSGMLFVPDEKSTQPQLPKFYFNEQQLDPARKGKKYFEFLSAADRNSASSTLQDAGYTEGAVFRKAGNARMLEIYEERMNFVNGKLVLLPEPGIEGGFELSPAPDVAQTKKFSKS